MLAALPLACFCSSPPHRPRPLPPPHTPNATQWQAALTREEAKRRQRSLDALGVAPFGQVLAASGAPPLARGPTTILQLNIGLYCNQACRHCHVESSPMCAWECIGSASGAGMMPWDPLPPRPPPLLPRLTPNRPSLTLHRRTEMMSREVAERCVALMAASAGSIATIDITGGAPELMPEFRCRCCSSVLHWAQVFSCRAD